MPYLRVVRGPEPGRLIELVDDVVTIGRGRKNTIIIHDNEISREHCRLVKVLFDYEIADLNSTNGTFLNGRPVGETSSPLFDKSIIELGDSIVLEYLASEVAVELLTPQPDAALSAQAAAQAALSRPLRKAATTNYYLVVRRRSQFMPEVYLLDSPLVDVGRHLDNAICLSENQVSRFHMRLNRVNDSYVLEDLGSMNGTFVNGTRVENAVILKPGDYITIGHVVEMWFTDDLETLRMVPNQPSAQPRPTAAQPAPKPTSPPSSPAPSDPLPGTTLLDISKLDYLAQVEAAKPTADDIEELQEPTESMPSQDPASDAAASPGSTPMSGLLRAASTILPPTAPNERRSQDIANATRSTEESPEVSGEASADASTEPNEEAKD